MSPTLAITYPASSTASISKCRFWLDTTISGTSITNFVATGTLACASACQNKQECVAWSFSNAPVSGLCSQFSAVSAITTQVAVTAGTANGLC
jgi:hypothetical protein